MRLERHLAAVATYVVGSVLVAGPAGAAAPKQDGEVVTRGIYRGVGTAVRFDVSPPLRSIPPLPFKEETHTDKEERDSGLEGPLGPQDVDRLVQSLVGPGEMPTPIVTFNGPTNLSGVSPPDPVGDVGPNHYVAMSNLSFAVYDKNPPNNVLLGPLANNTLWAGFGGPCSTENSGDPIVLYDQLADRWILTQFTSAGPTFFNCVAISTSGDPTGTYFRYAFSTGSNFPDYPKYGVWPDAYYISTREFAGASFAGVGAYALNRAQMIAGNPAAQVISFVVPPGATPFNIGDGLLPADMDGATPPPAGTPEFYMGSMDNGGPYGAPQDALTLWKFHVDFGTPALSTFTLTNTIPIAAYDTIFPCSPGSRDCIPQPGTAAKIDILSYRQRPMHRLAYRNRGTHQSLVTNQSVEATAGVAGIRWWEVRDPNGTPTLFQDATYAPADGIHRWMGSIAIDTVGNMALGFSASNATTTFPSVWYTGRLAGDPLNQMPQGEASIINGTGSQTGSQRWGDYSSMNVDPADDCTFWYVSEWVPTTSSVGWVLRIGSFKFPNCSLALTVTPPSQAICAPANADYNVSVTSAFVNPVTLSASGNPAGTTVGFLTNPVTPPGSTTMTIGNTGAAAAGPYTINVQATASDPLTVDQDVHLDVFTATPGTPTLTAPADNAINQPVQPSFSWSAASQAATYTIEIATDAGFTIIVHTGSNILGTSYSGATLNSNTPYFWRVRADNTCGTGGNSGTFSFTTLPLPGDCPIGQAPVIGYTEGFEAGAAGWTHSAAVGADSWAISGAVPHAGTSSFLVQGPTTVSDQRLLSPALSIPAVAGPPITLQYFNRQSIEDQASGTACFDGAILEVSTSGSGGPFTQVTTGLQTDPYTGPVSSGFASPIAGLNAWCRDPVTPSYLKSIVDISSFAGQTVHFRFRFASDNSVSRANAWSIDDVLIQACGTFPVELQDFTID